MVVLTPVQHELIFLSRLVTLSPKRYFWLLNYLVVLRYRTSGGFCLHFYDKNLLMVVNSQKEYGDGCTWLSWLFAVTSLSTFLVLTAAHLTPANRTNGLTLINSIGNIRFTSSKLIGRKKIVATIFCFSRNNMHRLLITLRINFVIRHII